MDVQNINQINNLVSQYINFEFKIHSINNNTLILVGSEDLYYYHSLSIYFKNIHTIILSSQFSIDTKETTILLIEGTEEAYALNIKYMVTTGNSIFKIVCEDKIPYYIIAESISFSKEIVKYYKD